MGVSIHVIVDPTCISRAAWARVYDETVTVLRGWPDPPIRPARRTIAGIDSIVYTRDVVDADGWHICGDAHSRLRAESIMLPRELGVDQPREPPSDLLVRVLAMFESFRDLQGLQWLLGSKTQGRPFHWLVLAVAMLIEHRLPHAALVGGDFTSGQACDAQGCLREILGEEISLPLAAEPERLRERLRPHIAGVALDEAVDRLRCNGMTAAVLIGLLDGTLGGPGAHIFQEIERAVGCTDVSTLDPLTREAFEFLVEQSKALFGHRAPGADSDDSDAPSVPVGFPPALAGLDASGLLSLIAAGAQSTHLRLTEMAWHEIQRASPAELRLLAMIAPHPTAGLIASQLRHAVFESVAVRQFCVKAWEYTEPLDPRDFPWAARFFQESRSG